ncbi:I10R1 protein, partial [Drymodes brunneopygia]|nr:I10R1 protein [Drymodes brunneopygia]
QGCCGDRAVQPHLSSLCPAGEGLAGPQRVRFAAEVARHLLRWEPGQGCPNDTRYDVEYLIYGSNHTWTAIPECRRISEHSCDLTYYTLNPEQRYFARVRAVSGNHQSPWNRTSSFSPQEAGLRLAGQSLSVRGNSIQVRLQLLLRSGNITVEFSDFQREMTRYHVYVRRTRDNHTITVVEKSTEFTLRDLFWVTEYCLSVEPSMANRPVPTTRTDEHCVTTGHRDRSAELLPGMLSSSFIILLLLGALLAHTYIRKPVRTPSVLKSFMKQSSLWVEHEPPSSGSLDPDPIQQLFLCQREPQLDSSSDSSTSTAQPQLPRAEDSGVGLESPCPAPACSSGSGNASPGEPELSPTIQEDVEFRGYLQQSKGTVEPEQAPEKEMSLLGCAGSMQGLGSTDTVLDMECPELAVSKGYLKQSSPEHPLTQDLAPWGAPAWDCSSQVGPQAPTLLSWAAPGAPLTSKASPDLKTPFDLSVFNSTELLGTLPLISSLSPDWIMLPIKPLGQLGGDSKDSRL